jgi:cation:H+ antiporter
LLLIFLAGLCFLIIGAEFLVRGASRLASSFGISPLIVGLTVVAFGTSSPELAVSMKSVLSGQTDIALGNVIGSNIFNILFILGTSAIITPLLITQQLVRLDVPLMILASCTVLIFGIDHKFSRIEGIVLFTGIIAYTVFLIYQSRKEKNKMVLEEYAAEYGNQYEKSSKLVITYLGLIIGGFGLLVIGSRWLVDSAVIIAHYLGFSDLVISLTIVAAGTSLPEVFTSIIASIKGERDIAVGNIIGSNIFNLLAVLGLSSIFAPSGICIQPHTLIFDVPIMIAVAVACLPIFVTGNLIARWEGAVFLCYYFLYTIYLILSAINYALLPVYSTALIYFFIPLTVVTILISFARIRF